MRLIYRVALLFFDRMPIFQRRKPKKPAVPKPQAIESAVDTILATMPKPRLREIRAMNITAETSGMIRQYLLKAGLKPDNRSIAEVFNRLQERLKARK